MQAQTSGQPRPGEPYCSNCGYQLTGLTESSRCPECGRPLVEVLVRRGMILGRRYTSPTRVFGLPLVSIAVGPGPEGTRGVARGIIAIGDLAVGFLALGGMACGILAFGGLSLGVCAFGGLAGGLLTAMGGLAIAPLAVGGVVLGLATQGGLAAGLIADGGLAWGMISRSGDPRGPGMSPQFRDWYWLMGRRFPAALALWVIVVTLVTGLLTAGVVLIGLSRGGQRGDAPTDGPGV